MDRKTFIKTCGLACLGGAALTTVLQSCAGNHYVNASENNARMLSIKKTDFEKPGKNGPVKKPYVLVKPASSAFPICIYHLGEEKYSALLLECTHSGCELQAHGDFLVCPCHGSEFSKLGVVQNPPAEQNLKTFKVTSDHENIYLQF